MPTPDEWRGIESALEESQKFIEAETDAHGSSIGDYMLYVDVTRALEIVRRARREEKIKHGVSRSRMDM